jgi:hypothetical protein
MTRPDPVSGSCISQSDFVSTPYEYPTFLPSSEFQVSRFQVIRREALATVVGKDAPRFQVTQTADMAPRSGKTYFITGAGSGLGEATARMLHSQGANVCGDAANMRFCIGHAMNLASAPALRCAFARWSIGQVALSHKLYTTHMLICSLSDCTACYLSAACSLDCPSRHHLTTISLLRLTQHWLTDWPRFPLHARLIAARMLSLQATPPLHACRSCMVSSHVTPLPLACVRVLSASKVGIDFGSFTCACMVTASGLLCDRGQRTT